LRRTGATQAELHLRIAATQLRGKFLGQRLLLPGRDEDHRRTPGAAGHLVIGIAQQSPGDRRPCTGVLDLGQGVQRLAPRLRVRRMQFLEQLRHGDLRRKAGQSPGERVANVEVGFDRASRDERVKQTGFRIRADGERSLEPRRVIARGQGGDQIRDHDHLRLHRAR
jgi:hypothetical protein